MDANLLVRALIGDRANLLGYIRAIVRDPHLAEDVFQMVTMLAMEKASEINDSNHLVRWARKTARFKALELLRRNQPRTIPLDEDVMELLEAEWDTINSASSGEDINHLRACLDRLSPHSRLVIGLRYTQGLSGAKVAQALQIKVQSVYVALARIYRVLEDCVRQRRLEGIQHA